jgi:hypothetical protein
MERPEVYYDVGRKDYWILNTRGDWITVNETGLKRQLRACGFSAKPREGEVLSDLDDCLNRVQRQFDVTYAGPLAGYQKGLTEMCGQRILITSSPKLIMPRPGQFPILDKLLRNLFPDEQRLYVCGWLKIAYESLRESHLRPGQLLVLAGEVDSGKSFFQKIITEILGGRSAKPFRYMSGATDFNSDLLGAEHLVIEDEIASTDIRARRAFGARIKDFTVNEVQSCHAKNRQAISLKPLWRVSLSLNEESENLLILPPLDESMGDKIILLKVSKAPFPMPTFTEAQRVALWATLIRELPAFLHFLNKWEIPEGLKCDRFGVKHFHHPALVEALDELTPEVRLLALIDLWFKTDDGLTTEKGSEIGHQNGFEGTADRLQMHLFASPLHGYEAKKLLTWPHAAATYLSRLENKHPDRIQYRRTASERIWVIKPRATG